MQFDHIHFGDPNSIYQYPFIPIVEFHSGMAFTYCTFINRHTACFVIIFISRSSFVAFVEQ